MTTSVYCPDTFGGFCHCPQGRSPTSSSADPTDLPRNLCKALSSLSCSSPTPRPTPSIPPSLCLGVLPPFFQVLPVLPGAVPCPSSRKPPWSIHGWQGSSAPLSLLSPVFQSFPDHETTGGEDCGVCLSVSHNTSSSMSRGINT